jgi:hypothetical protein
MDRGFHEAKQCAFAGKFHRAPGRADAPSAGRHGAHGPITAPDTRRRLEGKDRYSSSELKNRSSRRQACYQADQEYDQENEKQYFGDAGGGGGDAAKSKDRGDDRDDKEDKCPSEHGEPSQQRATFPIGAGGARLRPFRGDYEKLTTPISPEIACRNLYSGVRTPGMAMA